MEKISIIIPVYQVAQYLAACIESCLNQSYQHLEVILVDDGSPDESLRICEHYRQRDSRVRIVCTKNQGISRARNKGIQVASGDYIAFVDSDDTIAPDYLQHLYQSIKQTHSEVAVGSFYRIDDQNVYYFISRRSDLEQAKLERTYTPHEFFQARKHPLINRNFEFLWGKLFKKELFDLVECPTKLVLAEDAYTTWKLYAQARQIVFVNRDEYCYRLHTGSVTGRKDSPSLIALRAHVLKAREEQVAMEAAADLPISSGGQAQDMLTQLILAAAAGDSRERYQVWNAKYLQQVIGRFHRPVSRSDSTN